jgi:hypothetical protein
MFKLVEKFYAVITISADNIICLEDCDSYMEAYKRLEDFIDEQDDKLWDDGGSMFEFSFAKIEKRYVREWD